MRTTELALFVALIPCFCPAADLESRVFSGINAVRRSHGLPRLNSEPRLENAARSQCLWMASVGRMDHLREPAASFEEFVTGEYHPSNRVVKSGYFAFKELFRVEMNKEGASVHPLPAANEKVGEIIAKGWGGQGAYDHNRVVVGWMNSPGHRAEILNCEYREMGVAVCSPRDGETYWCVVFACR